MWFARATFGELEGRGGGIDDRFGAGIAGRGGGSLALVVGFVTKEQ